MHEKYQVLYLSIAQKDLIEIVDYIAGDNPQAARKFIDEIDTKAGNLTSHPFIGTVPRDQVLKSKGYRYLVIGNYLVFYVVDAKVVEIRRILHLKRDYRNIL
jgi:addiction module RelE/StbE family toxin